MGGLFDVRLAVPVEVDVQLGVVVRCWRGCGCGEEGAEETGGGFAFGLELAEVGENLGGMVGSTRAGKACATVVLKGRV